MKTAEQWKSELDACRDERKKFVEGVWRDNVAYRVQKPFTGAADTDSPNADDQVPVPSDWTRTRSKEAALFSRIPRISLTPAHPRWSQAVPVFETIVNHYVPKAGAGSVMEECMADVINAAGLCAAYAQYEATFEDVPLPVRDPLAAQLLPEPAMGTGEGGAPPDLGVASAVPPSPAPMAGVAPEAGTGGGPAMAAGDAGVIPPPVNPAPASGAMSPAMTAAPRTISERIRWYRISPNNLLWPSATFKGADWQRAEWLGYDGTMPWAQAKREFKLEDSQKDEVCGTDDDKGTLASEGNTANKTPDAEKLVSYSVIFYWAAMVDESEKRLDAIKRMVWVKGLEKPIIDEPYKGQVWNEQKRQFVGCTRLPIEVATLTYISDMAVPPSDSEIGRPQVQEQIRSRSQMVMQRTRNLPIRTFDVNRVDPMIAALLMRGVWQGMIPTNGPGDRVLAQIAASAFPPEDFTFDKITNRDLDDAWSMGPNQGGNFATGERSASEANIVQQSFASVIGKQRDKVVAFFLGLVETTMGLLQLTLDNWDVEDLIGPDGEKRLATWDRKNIDGQFVAVVHQDATVLKDSQQRLQELMRALNLVGKSGYVNVQPIIGEILQLSGIDPGAVMIQPKAPDAPPPSLSYRITGEDLGNPFAVALIQKTEKVSQDDIKAAKILINDCKIPGPPPAPPAPAAPGAPPEQGAQPNPDDWQAQERITKRPDEMGG